MKQQPIIAFFAALAKRIDLSDVTKEDIAVIAFNPLNYERDEIVEVEIVKSKAGELVNHGSMMTANNIMENEFLRVRINANGTFDLTHKKIGRVFSNCHFFEDDAEAGDPWTRVEPLQNRIVSFAGLCRKHQCCRRWRVANHD